MPSAGPKLGAYAEGTTGIEAVVVPEDVCTLLAMAISLPSSGALTSSMEKVEGSVDVEVHEIVVVSPLTMLAGVLNVMAIATLTAAARRAS